MEYSSEPGFPTTLLSSSLHSLHQCSRRMGIGLLLLSFTLGVRSLYVGAFADDGYAALLTMGETDGEGRMKSWVSHGDAYPVGQAAVQGQLIEGDFVFRYLCAP